MSVNFSSFSTDSLLPPHPSSVNYSMSLYTYCLISRPSAFIFIAVDITTALSVLPLCIFILYQGLQQWQQKRSTRSAATTSHCDCFTYHMAVMEIIGALGNILNFFGICTNYFRMLFVAAFFTCLTWYGQVIFHILTCVERYLAVVHPITYMRLRNRRGIMIRNVSIGCGWLLSCAGMLVMMMTNFFSVIDFCILILALIVISWCSLSVLCVLIRPGPGEQGGGRERVDQSKRRAFYTLVTILGVLVVRFAWNVVWEVLFMFGGTDDCVIIAVCVCFNLPSSLVLPLLFLHRAGKLVFCKNIIQRGHE